MDPRNAGVLRYLAGDGDPAGVTVVRPDASTDTRHLGANPAVVDYLWDGIGATLPIDGRYLVADTPALLDAESGLVVALAIGTQYAIRLAGDALATARAEGFATSHTFATVGRTLDLADRFGPDWAFGRFDPREPAWLAETVRAANL